MSSKEIAELLDVRHDNVKVAIERLALRKVVTLPSLQEVTNTGPGPRTILVYQLDKRSSLIVVAQLSPEFTARVVDRWQELEAQVAAPAVSLPNFNNPAEAARAWALAYEQADSQIVILGFSPKPCL